MKLIVLIFATASASLFNSQNRIAKVWDSLYIYNSTNMTEENLLTSTNMTTFPYIDAVIHTHSNQILVYDKCLLDRIPLFCTQHQSLQ